MKRNRNRETLRSREKDLSRLFWSRVNIGKRNECWKWTGGKNRGGYGRFFFEYRAYSVHRLAYELAYRKLSQKTLVKQTCENRLCCNPNHLIETNMKIVQTSMAEQGITRGFAQRGEKNASAKLTKKQVLEIRKLYIPRVFGYKKIANLFGVSVTAVGDVIRGTWWKWIPNKSIDKREARA